MTSKKKVLTRADLLAAKTPCEEVELAELGGTVWVQGLTGAEFSRYQETVLERKKGGQRVPNLTIAQALLIACSLVDEDRKPFFTEDELGLLNQIPQRELQQIWNKAAELSGLSEADAEEMERDFGNGQKGVSSIASLATSESPPENSPTGSPPAS